MVIYLIGSLRNPKVPEIGNYLRSLNIGEIFDDWFAAGPIADDSWQEYEKGRGHTFEEALKGYAARHVFSFDFTHLNRCDAGVLVLPAGKSGHLELGYLRGQGKPSYILLDGEPDRYDQMYQFATGVYTSKDKLGEKLREHLSSRTNAGDQGLQLPSLQEGCVITAPEGPYCLQPSGERRAETWEGHIKVEDRGLKGRGIQGF